MEVLGDILPKGSKVLTLAVKDQSSNRTNEQLAGKIFEYHDHFILDYLTGWGYSTPYILDTASLDIGDLQQVRNHLLQELNFSTELKTDIVDKLSFFLNADRIKDVLDKLAANKEFHENDFMLSNKLILGIVYYIYRFYDISTKFQSNQEILLDAIERNASAFWHASADLQNDLKFIEKSLERNGLVLKILPREMQNDELLVTKAVKQNGKALLYAGDKFKANQIIVEIAIKQNAEAFLYISPGIAK